MKNVTNLIKLACNAGWGSSRQPKIKMTGAIKLRRSQPEAVEALCRKRHVILNAPTGWGKSLVIAILCLFKMLRNKQLRCVIAVPQTIIARSFVTHRKLPFGQRFIDWLVVPENDLCRQSGTGKAKANRLVQFLADKHPAQFSSRIMVCSHATLSNTYALLKRRRRLSVFNNTLVWIDEAHHVMNAQIVNRTTTRSNRLGELVTYLVNSDSAHVGLATATFMRGDLRHIVPESMEEHFTRHDVPYDVYFNSMNPLESFEFNIMCSGYREGIARIFAKKVVPTIIYLPKRNSRYATKCKHTEFKSIINTLARTVGARPRKDGCVIMLGDLRVLDLVSTRGREKRKTYLDDGKPVDIIIALDMCKEGFDWVKAERSIIIGERHSVPEMIQMIGRLFRDNGKRKAAEVYQLLPVVPKNRAKFKEYRNNFLTVVFSSMLLEDVFAPLCFAENSRGRGKIRRMAEVMPDTEAFNALLQEFLYLAIEQEWQCLDDSIPHRNAMLHKHGVSAADFGWVWTSLWLRSAKLTCTVKQNKLNVTFEVLKHTSVTEGILMLASGICNGETFAELREAIGRGITRTPEQWVPIAEQLARDNVAGKLEGTARYKKGKARA